MPAGVDAEFHAKGLLAPGSDVLSGHCQCLNTVTDGGLKQSINTLQLGPSLSFFQFIVENFTVEQLFQRRFKSII